MAWTFNFNINNQSGRELVTDKANYDLKWGYWYRDNVDDREPISVPAGKNIQALGIRAARGTWTGYECICTWRDNTDGPGNYGTISLSIDVPFSGDNKSSCTGTGLYNIDGWTDLPKSGNSFVRSIIVTVVDGKLMAEVDNTIEPKDQKQLQETENSFNQYQTLLSGANELVENWLELEKNIPQKSLDPTKSLPKEPVYPPEMFLLVRSSPKSIEKAKWVGIFDPRYQTTYTKQTFVEEYFSVSVWSINTNPRDWESIPSGTGKKTVKSTEVTSSIKTVLETNISIKASLSTKAGDPKVGGEIAASLESSYSQKNVLEESRSRIEKDEVTVDIKPAEQDRLFVPWVFSQAIVIYRKTKKGTYGVVAISEWADLQLFKTYTY
jgi:hypothetical protein